MASWLHVEYLYMLSYVMYIVFEILPEVVIPKCFKDLCNFWREQELNISIFMVVIIRKGEIVNAYTFDEEKHVMNYLKLKLTCGSNIFPSESTY